MSNKFKTRITTETLQSNTSNEYPQIQGNNSRLTYTSKPSSIYYSQSKAYNEEQSKNSYIPRHTYLQRNNNNYRNLQKESPNSNFNLNLYKRMTEKNKRSEQEKSFEPSERKAHHSFYFSEFIKDNKKDEPINKHEHSSTFFFMKNYDQNKLNQKYQIHEIKNKKKINFKYP